MRPVRVPEWVVADIHRQLQVDRAAVFVSYDMAEALRALELVSFEQLPEVEESPGLRRFTVDLGRTVAGYHLIIGPDVFNDDPDALVVLVVDIWRDAWPDDTRPPASW